MALEHDYDPLTAQILDAAFSCQTCGLTPSASAESASNEDQIRISASPQPTTPAVTGALWVLDCGHVFCKNHINVPFFALHKPPPQVYCPTCLAQDETEQRAAVWINGVATGRYDEKFAMQEFLNVVKSSDPFVQVLLRNLTLSASFWRLRAEKLRSNRFEQQSSARSKRISGLTVDRELECSTTALSGSKSDPTFTEEKSNPTARNRGWSIPTDVLLGSAPPVQVYRDHADGKQYSSSPTVHQQATQAELTSSRPSQSSPTSTHPQPPMHAFNVSSGIAPNKASHSNKATPAQSRIRTPFINTAKTSDMPFRSSFFNPAQTSPGGGAPLLDLSSPQRDFQTSTSPEKPASRALMPPPPRPGRQDASCHQQQRNVGLERSYENDRPNISLRDKTMSFSRSSPPHKEKVSASTSQSVRKLDERDDFHPENSPAGEATSQQYSVKRRRTIHDHFSRQQSASPPKTPSTTPTSSPTVYPSLPSARRLVSSSQTHIAPTPYNTIQARRPISPLQYRRPSLIKEQPKSLIPPSRNLPRHDLPVPSSNRPIHYQAAFKAPTRSSTISQQISPRQSPHQPLHLATPATQRPTPQARLLSRSHTLHRGSAHPFSHGTMDPLMLQSLGIPSDSPHMPDLTTWSPADFDYPSAPPRPVSSAAQSVARVWERAARPVTRDGVLGNRIRFGRGLGNAGYGI